MPEHWSARKIYGSPANYWSLSDTDITNMQWTVTPVDPLVPIFRRPHCCVSGIVAEVIHEDDGDIHIWLRMDQANGGIGKSRLACEIDPQSQSMIQPPNVGQHVRIYGILRYDIEHQWSEIHPVDHIESVLPSS